MPSVLLKHELEAQDIECTRLRLSKRGTTYHYQCPKAHYIQRQKAKRIS